MKKNLFKTIQTLLVFSLAITLTNCGEIDNPLEVLSGGGTSPSIKATSITLSETTLNKNVGDAHVTLTATVKPDDATDKTVTWSSSDKTVATVADGVVSFVGGGTAIIKATADDGSGVEATCTITVTGMLTGKFTINDSGDQVQFSQANLQYTISTGTWSFMDHQWSTVEILDQNVGVNYANQDVVSLFGWGTAGHSFTGYGSHYQPWTTQPGDTEYGPTGTFSLTGTYAQGDWGTNAISNGGNTANSGWRTLTTDEWSYLIGIRSGATVNSTDNVRCTMATINTDGTAVKGLILFPDGLTFAADEATWGTFDAKSNYTTQCSTAQWTALADKGCVFLPAAGQRDRQSFPPTVVGSTGEMGCYWSSTVYSMVAGPWEDATNITKKAWGILFNPDYFTSSSDAMREYGRSVRLVRDVE